MQEIYQDLIKRFSSRKFLLAVLGVVAVFLGDLTPEQIAAITALIIAFTTAEGAADYAERKEPSVTINHGKLEDTKSSEGDL